MYVYYYKNILIPVDLELSIINLNSSNLNWAYDISCLTWFVKGFYVFNIVTVQIAPDLRMAFTAYTYKTIKHRSSPTAFNKGQNCMWVWMTHAGHTKNSTPSLTSFSLFLSGARCCVDVCVAKAPHPHTIPIRRRRGREHTSRTHCTHHMYFTRILRPIHPANSTNDRHSCGCHFQHLTWWCEPRIPCNEYRLDFVFCIRTRHQLPFPIRCFCYWRIEYIPRTPIFRFDLFTPIRRWFLLASFFLLFPVRLFCSHLQSGSFESVWILK